MKTFCDSIACAVTRQPSISRGGLRSMISRSLNVPRSDSSAVARQVRRQKPPPHRFRLQPTGLRERLVAADRLIFLELRQVALVGVRERQFLNSHASAPRRSPERPPAAPAPAN